MFVTFVQPARWLLKKVKRPQLRELFRLFEGSIRKLDSLRGLEVLRAGVYRCEHGDPVVGALTHDTVPGDVPPRRDGFEGWTAEFNEWCAWSRSVREEVLEQAQSTEYLGMVELYLKAAVPAMLETLERNVDAEMLDASEHAPVSSSQCESFFGGKLLAGSSRRAQATIYRDAQSTY